MTKDEIYALRKKHDLTRAQFGEAIGVSDPSRVVRGWEHGHVGRKPFLATGSALAAMRLLDAVMDTLEMELPVGARDRLLLALPMSIVQES